MTLTRRQWILGALLSATLAAVAWVADDQPAATPVSKPSLRTARRVAAATAPDAGAPRDGASANSTGGSASPAGAGNTRSGETVEPQRLVRLVTLRQVGNPFQGPPPPPAPAPPKPAITLAPQVPVAPPAPTAPPFPWTFMGRLIEDPKNPVMFLSKGDRLTMAHIGDTLQGGWKVYGMDARGMRVEYLPLKQSQTVALAAGSESSTSSGGVAPPPAADNAQPWAQPQPAAANAPALIQQLQQQGVQPPPQPAAPEARAEPQATPGAPAAVSGIDVSSGVGGVTLH